jgi:hypothetical protein
MRGRRATLKECLRCSACGVQCLQTPPTVALVATHYLEPFTWAKPVLALHPRLTLVIYECGATPLPAGVRSHPRVLLRDKSGALAHRDPFFSFFDHIVRSYDALADYTLFMHGHDTHYHRQAPTALVVEQAFRLVDSRAVGYVNLGAAVHSTWAGCASFGAIQRAAPAEEEAAGGATPPAQCRTDPPCASMTSLVNSSWSLLGDVLGGAAPAGVADINGNEALVSRCRLLARPPAFWSGLRDLTKQHHSLLAYGLEGSFHRIMGEPWVRPFLTAHATRLNFVACGADAKDTLWPGRYHRYRGRPPPEFEERWQNHTELSLRAALPAAVAGAEEECALLSRLM